MTFAHSTRALIRSPFARFSLIGTCGFILNESVLALLHYVIGVDRYGPRVVSIFCAATFTWWGNRTLTFAEHAATGGPVALAREWFRFMLANSVGALVNYAIYTICVSFAPAPLDNPLVATALGVGVGLIFNFTLSKRFVFRAP